MIEKNVKNRQNIELIFNQACAFYDCAEFTELESSKIVKRTNSHNYVDFSLSALSCELFTKCLIINYGGQYKKTHNLYDLWEELKNINSQITVDIEKAISFWFGTNMHRSIDDLIKESSKAFEEWRYCFEHDQLKITPQFLRGFRIVLRNYCYEAIKEKSCV